MSELVVLNLGPGNFNDGFPAVTARLGKPGQLGMQFTGSLPPAPELPELYRNWQLLYEALYRSGYRSGIEIAPIGVTHISEAAFSDVYGALEQGLNTWFASEGFESIERQLRTQLHPSQPVRLVVETDNEEVWRLPLHLWHFLQDEYRLSEIALSSPQYPAPPRRRSTPPREKVKILAILGNSVGIDVRKDRMLLEQLPGVELKFLVEPQRSELTEGLWQQGWDILFFAGHSSSNGEGRQGRLYINQSPQRNSLTVEELKEALGRAIDKGLQLAIFNSCDGLGLARDLAAAKIPLPTTIVMREPVADAVAQTFLKYFLRAFAFGEPFHLAVRQAREQLRGLEDECPGASWLPAICQHPAADPPTWLALSPRDIPAPTTTPDPWVFSPRKRRWRLTAAIVAVGIGGYFSVVPQVARWGHKLGMHNHDRGQFFTAQFFYRMAARLDPRFAAPHYNLGWLCDEMGDRQCAIEAHQRAALRGFSEAYAEVGRLQILDGDDAGALRSIRQCLERTEYDAVKAACLKNLGWLRLKQERYDEAETELAQAIALKTNSPHSHCLLAQVLEAQGKSPQAKESWINTLKYSDESVPEQDECIGLAKQGLR